MAAPVVEAVQTSFRDTAATSHVVVLPAGTVIGSRVTVEMATGRNNLAPGTTWPAGWVELVDNTPSEGGVTGSFAYHDYLATPPADITVTTVNACRFSAVARRLSGHDTATPPAAAFLSNTPDPPNLVFPWGTEETLVGSTFTSHEDPFPDPVDPLPNSQQSILSTQTRVDSCTNTVTAGAVDPAAWQPGGAEASARTVMTWAHRGATAGDPVVGELAVTLPALAVEASGTASAAGEATVALPGLSVAVEAAAATSGALGAVLPALGVDLTAAAAADGLLVAALPPLAVALDGFTAADGVLAAALPPLDVVLDAGAAAAGVLDVGLPGLQIDLQGTAFAPPVGELAAVLPALGMSLDGDGTVVGELGATLPPLSWGSVGHAGDMIVPLCEPWPLPENCAAPTGTAEALDAASTDLWVMSGQQFGSCVATLRPCRQECTNGWRPRSWWDGADWPVMRGPGIWWDAMCGRCRNGCSCNEADTLVLPDMVQSIVEVIVDGVVLPADSYVLYDGFRLVRADGERWPMCQDWTVPVSGVGAWSVQVMLGRPVPPGGSFAVAELAAEYARFCETGQCRLPAHTVAVSRQGVDQRFPSIIELKEAQMTGLTMVDRFLDVYNPNRLQEPAGFYNPDDYADGSTGPRQLTQGTP